MAQIMFREDLNQSKAIDDLNENKVNLTTYNTGMNDVCNKISNLRDDMPAADDSLKQLIADTRQGLIDNEIKTNVDAIALLNADSNTEGSVDNKIATAITSIVNGAPEAYDTLKELLDYINNEDTDLNGFIQQVQDKVNATIGNASEDWNTLEKIEVATKAIADNLQGQIDGVKADAQDIVDSIPHYKYDNGLAISGADNNVTLSLVPVDDIIGGKATVYSEDPTGNMIIEGIFTISKSTADNATAKDYVIDSDMDLSAFKAIVEYFYNNASNK